MDPFAENILHHQRHPHGKGRLSSPTVTHEEDNPACGDRIVLDLVMKDGLIADLKWEGNGCAISQAAMSLLAEELPRLSTEQLRALGPKDMMDLLGIPVGTRRIKCALLGLHTLQNALRAAAGEPPQLWAETLEENR